jgi:hypothetical protein
MYAEISVPDDSLAQRIERFALMAKKKLVTKSMVLDLEAMELRVGSSFPDRLDALLDELAVPPHGRGRGAWLAEAAGIRQLAAGNWFKAATPRKANLLSLCESIGQEFPVNVSEEQLYDFLSGKNIQIDVAGELTRSGLTSPEQGHVLTIVARAMKEKDLDPLDNDNLLTWTKVVLRVGRFYLTKHSAGNTPTEEVLLSTTHAFLELAQHDAI